MNSETNRLIIKIWVPTVYTLTSGSVLVRVIRGMVDCHGTNEYRLTMCDTQLKSLSGVRLPFMLNIHAAFIFAFSNDCTDLIFDTTCEGALLYFMADIRLG